MSQNIAMIGLFDHEPLLENKIFGKDIKVYQSLLEISKQQKESINGILAWHTDEFTKDELSQFPNLTGIVRIGMGFDNVDIQYCGERGIIVSNVPDYGTEEVADAAMSLILCLLRNTFKLGVQTTIQGVWPGQAGMKGARRVSGLTLGIMGFGRIGKCTTLRAKAFGMKVIFYDPYVEHGIDKSLGVKRISSLDEFLSLSDVVSVHCLLSSETRRIINTKNIFKMKKGAFLVNTARGPIVEEDAVIEGLKSGHLAGVGLDVLEIEPYNKNLMGLENLIITPHSAFYSEEGYVEMREKAAQDLQRILTKDNVWYSVNDKFMVKQ